jgi:hypothetical protein
LVQLSQQSCNRSLPETRLFDPSELPTRNVIADAIVTGQRGVVTVPKQDHVDRWKWTRLHPLHIQCVADSFSAARRRSSLIEAFVFVAWIKARQPGLGCSLSVKVRQRTFPAAPLQSG